VSRLIADQYPRWAHLPISRVELDGSDNTTFRLGAKLSVRLPSADAYTLQVEKEHRWLPILAPQLPLPIPTPVARGVPSESFPRPWSVYVWLEGEPATVDRVADQKRLATDLADFLGALYSVDPADGPPAGPHSFFRGGPLATYDGQTRETIRALAGTIDATAASAVWEDALAEEWAAPAVWVHGDVTASNLLAVDGRLSAVIDFGCAAVGDPACDTVIAWTVFSGASRQAFGDRLPVDEGTWRRGRGWALWKALNVVANGTAAQEPARRRFGWRVPASAVIDELLGVSS
jgi:aminoglycoside phosphotransferase (APT) family kinase protein